ncbi:hypothetical protein ACFY78_41905 [Streptomyces olindensis]|uniref:hypothetical protein n=1 Tax=Streptomyces olindensis TaxID=358823 RepID=UPI003673E345
MTHPAPLPPADVLDLFTDHVLATGQHRLTVAAVHRLWARADPGWPDAYNARIRLAHALGHLADAGLITLPAPGGRLWDAGTPRLPARIAVPANHRPPPKALDAADEPWGPAMHWAPAWIRTAHPPHHLRLDAVRINRWLLATTGQPRPVIAREERSLQIYNDEKRLTALTTGPLFAPGRLTLEHLACQAPTGALRIAILRPTGPVLVVENRATFDSAWHALRSASPASYAAVVFGGGDAASALVTDLTRLHDLTGVHPGRIDYAGDVDIAGIEAAHQFVTTARTAGLTAGLSHPLWQAVASSQPVGPDMTAEPVRAQEAHALARFLGMPSEVTDRLEQGVRVPQERIDRHTLRDTHWWAPPAHHQTPTHPHARSQP